MLLCITPSRFSWPLLMFHCTEILHFFNRAFMVKYLQKHLFVFINILCPDLAKFLISQKISKLFTNNYRGLQKCSMLSCQKWNGNICCHQFAACFKLWIFLKSWTLLSWPTFEALSHGVFCRHFFELQFPSYSKSLLLRTWCQCHWSSAPLLFHLFIVVFSVSFLCTWSLYLSPCLFLLRSLSLSILRPVYLSPSLHGDWLEAWIHHS